MHKARWIFNLSIFFLRSFAWLFRLFGHDVKSTWKLFYKLFFLKTTAVRVQTVIYAAEKPSPAWYVLTYRGGKKNISLILSLRFRNVLVQFGFVWSFWCCFGWVVKIFMSLNRQSAVNHKHRSLGWWRFRSIDRHDAGQRECLGNWWGDWSFL